MNQASPRNKFSLGGEPGRPRVVAAQNGQELKRVNVAGTFPWDRREAEAKVVRFEPAPNPHAGRAIDDAFTAANSVTL